MKTSSPAGIRLPRLPKRMTTEAPETILTDGEYTAAVWNGRQFSNQAAARVQMDQIHMRRVALSQTKIPDFRATDVRIESCDLAGIEWERARFRRVAFRNCRLVGAQFADSNWEDISFQECNFEHSVFTSAVFQAACFEKCQLRGAFFDGADLSGVRFIDCDLSGADLRGTTLRGADFRGSQISGLQIDAKDLQGAIIDPGQALQVVGLLGVVVSEQEQDEAQAGEG